MNQTTRLLWVVRSASPVGPAVRIGEFAERILGATAKRSRLP